MAALLEPNQIGKRESLADLIAVADAKSTPVTSMIRKGKDINNLKFEWLVDAYDAPNGAQGVVDGTDLSSYSNPAANRTRISNYGQVFQRNFRIGFLAQNISNVAGVSDEVARGLQKALTVVKRDVEVGVCSTDQSARVDNGTNSYRTTGLGKFLDSSNTGTNVGQFTSTYATKAASENSTVTGAFAESDWQGVLTSIYNEVGTIKTYNVPCGTTLKRAFTALSEGKTAADAGNNIAATTVRTFNTEQSKKEIVSTIDIVRGDFGTMILHPTTFIGTTTTGSAGSEVFVSSSTKGYVLDMDDLELRYGSLPEVKELPDAGGGPIRLIRLLAGLIVGNGLKHGRFTAAT
jgi:hypothetical protein